MKKDKKYWIRALIGTLLFHAVIVALLFIFGFTTQLPLPGEEGVEVNLGSSNQGLGPVQPKEPAKSKPSAPPPSATKQVEEEVVTQDIEDAPAMEEQVEEVVDKVPVQKIEEPIEEEKEPEVNPLAMYKGKDDSEAESASEGIAGGEGDQGSPGGDKDTKNYLGKGGFGDGPDWSLAGRTPKFLPKPSGSFTENGTVAVQITVNKYGKVVKAIAVDRGSTTTDSRLRKLAEQAALKAVFNAKTDASELQRGTITYHFIIKN